MGGNSSSFCKLAYLLAMSRITRATSSVLVGYLWLQSSILRGSELEGEEVEEEGEGRAAALVTVSKRVLTADSLFPRGSSTAP